MSKYEKFVTWLDSYRSVAFDLLRIYLGLGLLVRGALFLLVPSTYMAILSPSTVWLTSPLVYYTVSLVHIVGGAMMAVGFLTRLAALVQIPILLGAVFFVHLQGGLMRTDQSFEFAALVLFLLILVFLHGSGRWSVDATGKHSIRPFKAYVERLDISGDMAFELLRIYLGIGLLIRGALFISDTDAFMNLLGPSPAAQFASVALVHYVALVHLAGGAMMAVGLLTRLAALVQIPILLGAVFLVHFQGGLVTPSQSLEFSVLVLFLLCLVFLYGSGRWSADYSIARQEGQPEVEYAALLREARARAAQESPELAPVSDPSARGEAGQVAVAPPPRPAAEPVPLTCPLTGTCALTESSNPRAHPWSELTRRYSTLGGVYFVLGITGPPKEVHFRCKKCGQVFEVSRAPEDLGHYKYH